MCSILFLARNEMNEKQNPAQTKQENRKKVTKKKKLAMPECYTKFSRKRKICQTICCFFVVVEKLSRHKQKCTTNYRDGLREEKKRTLFLYMNEQKCCHY